MVEKASVNEIKAPLSQTALCVEIQTAVYEVVDHPLVREGIRIFGKGEGQMRRIYAVDLQGVVGWQHLPKDKKKLRDYDPLSSAIENLNRRATIAKDLLELSEGPKRRRDFIKSKQDKLLTSLRSQAAAAVRAKAS